MTPPPAYGTYLSLTYLAGCRVAWLAAAAGLVAGVWVDYLGTATCLALVAYFIIAMAMHVRAHDVGRNLFLNAAGMLVVCTATGVYSFVL